MYIGVRVQRSVVIGMYFAVRVQRSVVIRMYFAVQCTAFSDHTNVFRCTVYGDQRWNIDVQGHAPMSDIQRWWKPETDDGNR